MDPRWSVGTITMETGEEDEMRSSPIFDSLGSGCKHAWAKGQGHR